MQEGEHDPSRNQRADDDAQVCGKDRIVQRVARGSAITCAEFSHTARERHLECSTRNEHDQGHGQQRRDNPVVIWTEPTSGKQEKRIVP